MPPRNRTPADRWQARNERRRRDAIRPPAMDLVLPTSPDGTLTDAFAQDISSAFEGMAVRVREETGGTISIPLGEPRNPDAYNQSAAYAMGTAVGRVESVSGQRVQVSIGGHTFGGQSFETTYGVVRQTTPQPEPDADGWTELISSRPDMYRHTSGAQVWRNSLPENPWIYAVASKPSWPAGRCTTEAEAKARALGEDWFIGPVQETTLWDVLLED